VSPAAHRGWLQKHGDRSQEEEKRERERRSRSQTGKKEQEKTIKQIETRIGRTALDHLGLWGEDPVPAREQGLTTETSWVGAAPERVVLESVQNGGFDLLSPETKAKIHNTLVLLQVQDD